MTDGVVVVPSEKKLLGFSAAGGGGEWQSKSYSNTRSLTLTQPTNSPNRIYVFSEGNEKLRQVDPVTGETTWQNDLSGYLQDVTQAPTVADGRVYGMDISVHDHGSISKEPYHGNVTAWSVTDGSKEWTNTIQHNAKGISNRITYNDGYLYVGTRGGAAEKIDAETGEQIWRTNTLDSVYTYPVYANSKVYFATNSSLAAIDPSIGTKRWSVSLSGTPTSPVYADGTLYLGSTDNNVYAYDAQNGNQKWNFSIGSSITAPPVIAGDIIYVASTDGSLYALSKTDATPAGPDVVGDGNPAQDLDGDGLYEDVNGDGSPTIVDVQALFANLDSDAVQENVDLFDFNGDGEVDVSDVQALYDQIQ